MKFVVLIGTEPEILINHDNYNLLLPLEIKAEKCNETLTPFDDEALREKQPLPNPTSLLPNPPCSNNVSQDYAKPEKFRGKGEKGRVAPSKTSRQCTTKEEMMKIKRQVQIKTRQFGSPQTRTPRTADARHLERTHVGECSHGDYLHEGTRHASRLVVRKRKGGALVHSPVPTTQRTRVQQAAALFKKAKLALSSSRSLSSEIKDSILESWTQQTYTATTAGRTLSLSTRIGWRCPHLPAATAVGRDSTMSNITPLATTVPLGEGKSLARAIADSGNPHTVYTDPAISDSQLSSFVLLGTDPSEVESTLMTLDSRSAAGWDNISTAFLKRAKEIVVPVISDLINLSFEKGIFPEAFKRSIITPVYKSGNKDEITNYRPISVLTSISKIMEKILNKRLLNYLNKFNIISRSQYGFRKGISTEDAIGDLTKLIVQQVDKNQKCLMVFLDLKKAFDTVSVPILLRRLEGLGIRDKSLSLFASYLKGRKQSVKIGEFVSDTVTVDYVL
ncbi:unnamed protein product [Euphydryas editha]|uniref:Reverse transcriptase domain-containing protein n=1 Tax=Euphydryas editha TaxID=104508 RepID=A0AAU9UAI3_EUPED|nr:unnamed protein product [Euphydryas editha]